jgi:uncharacterized protein YqeY
MKKEDLIQITMQIWKLDRKDAVKYLKKRCEQELAARSSGDMLVIRGYPYN